MQLRRKADGENHRRFGSSLFEGNTSLSPTIPVISELRDQHGHMIISISQFPSLLIVCFWHKAIWTYAVY